jgi:hypothetical protein
VDGSGCRGARERRQQGGEQSRDWGEDDAWKEEKQEVERRPGAKHYQRQENRAGQHVPEEEEERGGGPGDLFVNSKNFKDLSVKKDFKLK